MSMARVEWVKSMTAWTEARDVTRSHRGVFLEKGTSAEREEFIKGAQDLCLRSIKTAIAKGMPKNDKEWEAWVLGDCGIN